MLDAILGGGRSMAPCSWISYKCLYLVDLVVQRAASNRIDGF
jgi:hypothetical protein